MDTPKAPSTAADKKVRHRSPNYPAVGLAQAVERVERLYKKDGKAGAPANLAAVHIGFASAHGEAMSVVAALKKFGLVSMANGRVVPTQRAIEILNLPEKDSRRLKALQDAVLSPDIYRTLIDQHKETGFPSDDVLESELVTYKGFNPNTVKGFVGDFKESLNFAGLSDIDALKSPENEDVDVGDYVQWTSAGVDQFAEPLKIRGFSEDGEFAFVDGSETGVPVDEVKKCSAPTGGTGEAKNMPETQVSERHLNVTPPTSPLNKPVGASIPVTRDCSMTVMAAGPVTQKGIDQLVAYLNLIRDSFPE